MKEKRFVEHETCVDIEKFIQGLGWVVVSCNAKIKDRLKDALKKKQVEEIKKLRLKPHHKYYDRHKEEILNRHKKERNKHHHRKSGIKGKYSKYGMTQEDYDNKLKSQNGLCAICNKKQKSGRNQNLVVDHDHESGKVRDLLCNSCNVALGLFQDSIDILDKSIRYLKKHGK